MTELNYSNIAPEIASLLLIRGTSVPPLMWSNAPSVEAMEKLESLSFQQLFDGVKVKSKTLVDALKALLLLRNGWLDESLQLAQTVSENIRLYIAAFVQRQKNHPDEAKLIFQKLVGHPVYHSVARSAADRISFSEEAQVKRFGAIIEMNGDWEPFAFIDLYVNAVKGNLNDAETQFVCGMQLDEFNCLFAYCYEDITGRDVATMPPSTVSQDQIAA